MSDDLQKLKQDYQAINAPPHLAMRIQASVADSRTRTGFWMPAAVACTAILALFWVLPFTTQVATDETDAIEKPIRPSMSAIAALKPKKPSTSVSLSQIRSVSVPSMPSKPKAVAPTKPQTNNQIENDTLEENDNAYI